MTRFVTIVCKVMLIAVWLPLMAAAQQPSDDRKELLALLEKMKNLHLQLKGVKVDMRYCYANESTPDKHLDSLHGELLLNGNEYYMAVDGIETLVNSRYSVTLYQDDHLMYLSKPSPVQHYNPVASIDSLLTAVKGADCRMRKVDGYTEITIGFPGGQAYKSMRMLADTATGYLLQTTVVLKTQLLAPDADETSLKKMGYDDYAMVQTTFSGYQPVKLDSGYFDEARFFTRKNKDFQVTEKYRDYKIFVASPNL